MARMPFPQMPPGGPVAEQTADNAALGRPLFDRAIMDAYIQQTLHGKTQIVSSMVAGAPTPDRLDAPEFRRSMLLDRLRLHSHEVTGKLPQLGTTYGQKEQKVFVHFLRGGKLVVFEDDAGMYPSDQLTTQVRLCL